MTTKPKAKKFRIRRAAPLTVAHSAPDSAGPHVMTAAGEDGAAANAARELPNQGASTQPVLLRPVMLVSPINPVRAVPPEPSRPVSATSIEVGAARAAPAPANTSVQPKPAVPAAVPAGSAQARKADEKPAEPVLRMVAPPLQDAQMFAPSTDDGFGSAPYPTRGNDQVMSPGELSSEAELDQIRRESLTGRQLRMARRLAQKHGLPATSDFDAVRLLRRQGIDPFQRSNMLELVVGESQAKADAGQPIQLPQTIKPIQLPSPEVRQDFSRAQDIMNIQRDIARRRRRKMALLLARLTFFVFLPTLLAGIYFYSIATPMYSTRSEFLIQQAQPAGGGQLGGLFSGTQFATSQDSIAVQSYLNSRDAMQRLDQEIGFKAHFSQPFIDPIQRLEPDATSEQAYRLFRRNVKIGYDPTEGIIKMEVIAVDPATSAAFSNALISYAEEQVDHLTQRLREDQMSGARTSFEDAEAKMLGAQREVVELQEKYKVLSSEIEVGMLTGQISSLDAQLTTERLRLQELMANPNPSKARVDPIRNTIANLEAEIASLRSKLTEDSSTGLSLAKIQSDLLVAEANVATRQLMLAQSLQSLETARIEANRQVRYLSMGVRPVAPDEASYPRAFEDTAVAFLIFAGIYLMLSMTASILREQVSA